MAPRSPTPARPGPIETTPVWHLRLHRVDAAGPLAAAWHAEATGPGGTRRFDSIGELSRWLEQLDTGVSGHGPGIR